jgi:putative membrane protein
VSASEQEPDYRFTLANERTLLAWNRTALALIAGGVAVIQFVPGLGIPGLRHIIAAALTGSGGVLALMAVRRWQRVQSAMRKAADLPATRMPLILSVGITAIAVVILVARIV